LGSFGKNVSITLDWTDFKELPHESACVEAATATTGYNVFHPSGNYNSIRANSLNLRLQHPLNSLQQPCLVPAAKLVFPNAENIPPCPAQRPRYPPVALFVTGKLAMPECPVGFGFGCVLRTAMPETTVHVMLHQIVAQTDFKNLSMKLLRTILQCIERIQHPFFSWALIVSKRIWYWFSQIQWRIPIQEKNKLCSGFFIAFLYLAIISASASEPIFILVGNVLGNPGTHDKNFVASVDIKLSGVIVCDFLKKRNNLGNIVSKTSQPNGYIVLAGLPVVYPDGDETSNHATQNSEENIPELVAHIMPFYCYFMLGVLIVLIFSGYVIKIFRLVENLPFEIWEKLKQHRAKL
jgi:hypothetical protein